MHTFSENSTGVPAFLAKLWRLVEDEETNNLIYWSAVSSFQISSKVKKKKTKNVDFNIRSGHIHRYGDMFILFFW